MPIHWRKLFIDSSVLLAFVDRADSNHRKSVQVVENVARGGYQLYTSVQNISETYAFLARELGLSVALEFLQATLQSDMEILFPQKTEFFTTFRLLRSNRERQVTLREALNATLMQKKGVMYILTFGYWHNLLGTHVANLIVP